MDEKTVSLRQIAQEAGVSVATVSRVIHKNGRFSKETEERVQAVIDRYHYSPDISAQSMRTKRVPAVGILYPDLANQHLADIVKLLEERLFDLGYATFVCGTRGDPAREEAYIKTLTQHKVSGMIFLFGAREDQREILGDLPKVYIGRTPSYLQLMDDCTVVIETDHVKSGYMAAEHLLKKGCKRILFPTRIPYATNLIQGREEGFLRALTAYGIENPEQFVVPAGVLKEEEGYNWTKQCIADGRQFDGICANTDRFAIGCVRALMEENFRVPEDVKVIGHDDLLIASYNLKRLTTIRDPIEEFCALAIDSLIGMMEGEMPTCNHYVLQGSVIERETT